MSTDEPAGAHPNELPMRVVWAQITHTTCTSRAVVEGSAVETERRTVSPGAASAERGSVVARVVFSMRAPSTRKVLIFHAGSRSPPHPTESVAAV